MKTPKQRREEILPIAKKVAEFIRREGIGPTVREIADMAGVKSSSHGQLYAKLLQDQGFISIKDGQPRGITMKESYKNL